MKTHTYGKTVDFDNKTDYIFVKGATADSCLIVAEGRCAVEGRPGDYAFEAHNLSRGSFIDEQAMLLARPTQRTYSGYADSDCIMCSLSNTDLDLLRAQRKEIDFHLRPYIKHARFEAFNDDIERIFGQSNGKIESVAKFSTCLQMLDTTRDMPERQVLKLWNKLSRQTVDGPTSARVLSRERFR